MPRIFTILNFRVSIDSSSRKNDTKTTTKFCLHLGWKKQKLEKTKSKNKREWQGSLYQLKSMKIIENQWKWAAAAGDPRGCGGGTPPQQLLAGPAAGDPGGVPPPTNCWQMLLWGSGGGYPLAIRSYRGHEKNQISESPFGDASSMILFVFWSLFLLAILLPNL